MATLITLISATGAVADDPPLRAAARVLSSESKPDADAQMPAATTPRGALPQYRDQLQSRAEPAGSQDAARRFMVPLPDRPILVEARVTVDGQPYRMMREVRISRLLAELATAPTPETSQEAPENAPETAPAAADSPAESPAKKEAPPAVDNSFAARLRRYAQATRRTPARDEVHWLLANWGEGPVVLVLSETFERVRAGQNPVVTVLDRDDDGAISAAELAGAKDGLLALDSNRDGVVSYEEIFEAADGLLRAGRLHAAVSQPAPAVLCADLAGDSQPDLRLTVAFSTQDAAQSTIQVELDGAHAASDPPAILRGSTITIQIAGALLELAAVQSPNGGQADQISVGAVNDGYPLLPDIDPNEDGKLTMRELRDVSGQLVTFDRNRDGGLSSDEIMPTVRVAIGLGPTVHRHLSALRSVHQPQSGPAVKAPDWFVRMDKNQDSDLTRSEFLGSDEQFNQLDADQDKLIDAAEAARDPRAVLRQSDRNTSDNSQSSIDCRP